MGLEETWTRTAEQRAELVAKARTWPGSQREFAKAHGVCQSTVSKWLGAAPPTTRPATADLRTEVVRRYGAGEGSQREIADAMGISRGMVFKWLAAEAGPRSLAVRPPRVPMMLEVVAVAAPQPVVAAIPAGRRVPLPARWCRASLRRPALGSLGRRARRGAGPMLNFPVSTKIYVCAEPVNIHRSFDALAGWVEANGLDVYSGDVFVFLSRRMTHIKALTWSRGGFVILHKRLEEGRFRFPARVPGARTVAIDATDLTMMLDGIDIQKVQRSKVWKPASKGLDISV